MATKKLSEAEKKARADKRAAAKAAQKAVAAGDPAEMAKAAAGLAGTAPIQPDNSGKHGRTVCVACKVPNGLVLQAYAKVVEYEDVMGGGKRAVDRFRPVGQQFKVHGTLAAVGRKGDHVRDNSGGYGITEGIPFDVWQDWITANAESAFVQNKLIFGDESLDKVLGWAREHGAVRTNFEPLNVSLVPDASGQRRIADLRARRAAPQVTDGKIEIGAA